MIQCPERGPVIPQLRRHPSLLTPFVFFYQYLGSIDPPCSNKNPKTVPQVSHTSPPTPSERVLVNIFVLLVCWYSNICYLSGRVLLSILTTLKVLVPFTSVCFPFFGVVLIPPSRPVLSLSVAIVPVLNTNIFKDISVPGQRHRTRRRPSGPLFTPVTRPRPSFSCLFFRQSRKVHL